MNYDKEPLSIPLEAEIQRILDDNYAHTPARYKTKPFIYMWETYEKLDAANVLVVTTARDDDRKLVGFAMYIVVPASHHRGQIMADCDGITIDRSYRGQGIGKGLYEYTESVLRTRGVDMVINRYRTCYEVEPIFPSLGFELVEHTYRKDL